MGVVGGAGMGVTNAGGGKVGMCVGVGVCWMGVIIVGEWVSGWVIGSV